MSLFVKVASLHSKLENEKRQIFEADNGPEESRREKKTRIYIRADFLSLFHPKLMLLFKALTDKKKTTFYRTVEML